MKLVPWDPPEYQPNGSGVDGYWRCAVCGLYLAASTEERAARLHDPRAGHPFEPVLN